MVKDFLKNYRVELIAIGFVILGVFLILEQYEIRETILFVLLQLFAGIAFIIRFVVDYVIDFTLSDLTGWLLVFSAIIFVLWRARWRVIQSPRFASRICPNCHGPLRRAHRTRLDHVLAKVLILPLIRYRCKNPECKWTGLRIREVNTEDS